MRYKKINNVTVNRLRKRQNDWSSGNWSGYARSANSGRYISVSGRWRVPAVCPSPTNTYSSTWIGIDGFNNRNLIQTGTESDYVNGAARYHAWWEILPNSERIITSLPVNPGDLMQACIRKLPSGRWRIKIANVTQGKNFATVKAYNGPQSSVEFIQEAPTVNGSIATLANYGKVIFNHCLINGRNPRFKTSEAGVMVQNGTQVSTPSIPDSDKDGFAVVYGSIPPNPPASLVKKRVKTPKQRRGNLKGGRNVIANGRRNSIRKIRKR
ncbi:G1 family glutamic endopeptidase [Alicyclobacillus fodiniaquatilis]|uniref:G1 family glutamic endopeptidase n=1 Tax=Alicyclobacillus fodiniaquatilis TaxID=1661150 RepID=A0ABW4JIC5_9BACL